MRSDLKVKIASEFFGSMFLLIVVVGSGIMGEKLSGRNEAIALLANSIATGAGLFVLIQVLSQFSAHFNPLVSGIEFLKGNLKISEMVSFLVAQFLGAIVGVLLTHVMFGRVLFEVSAKTREGIHLGISEFLATFGLISILTLAEKKSPEKIPALVASYITAAYWFTSSTSFANPAVTVARAFTDTFCGLAPSGVAMFILSQILGAGAAYTLLKKL